MAGMRRIGIDVGGTNTDAVLLEGDKVLFAIKKPTTDDVTGGSSMRFRPSGPIRPRRNPLMPW
jgi:N-methylhydantoinase A/acetone carboxylase, beta subunit